MKPRGNIHARCPLEPSRSPLPTKSRFFNRGLGMAHVSCLQTVLDPSDRSSLSDSGSSVQAGVFCHYVRQRN